MKWSLTTALLTATALATPVPAPDGDAYRLRIISLEKSLNGQILSVHNGLVGVFKSVKAPTLEVYALPAARSDQVTLHSYPGGSDTVLALIGENDLLNLSTVEDPNARGLRPNSTIDWSFSMSRRAPPVAEGRPDTSNRLLYTGRSGSWVTMPSGPSGQDYVVKFKGGDSYAISVDLPAQIVYERIE